MDSIDALCPGCFREKESSANCTACGFDESRPRSRLFLPYRTILHQQYVLGRGLGNAGSFGITYLAWDAALQTCVAIKEYFPRGLVERGADGFGLRVIRERDRELYRTGLAGFLREAQTLAKIDHPNVVRVRTFFQANETAYLVMDYVEGCSLAEWLRQHSGRLSIDEALRLMIPVLDGLAAVHDRGYLHNDVTPQNICLRSDGRPILLDFGAARLALGGQSLSQSVLVTPGFAPFEQYQRGGKLGPWTDVYGAAATLYNLLADVVPPGALDRQRHDDLVAPDRLVPGLSNALSRAITGALALDPPSRPQSVVQFREDLLKGHGPLSRAEEEAERLAATSRPSAPAFARRRRLTLGIAVALLVAGLITILLTRGHGRRSTLTPGQASTQLTSQPPVEPSAAGHNAVEQQPQPRETSPHRPGEIWTDPQTGIELAWIPPGSFMMGSSTYPDERPPHLVTIANGFWMQTTEVTQSQWRGVMSTKPWKTGVAMFEWMKEQDDCPAAYVTWSEVQVFVGQLNARNSGGYRIPSEAQWEYACRAGSAGEYCLGDNRSGLPEYAWYEENAYNAHEMYAHPVRKLTANAWGLYDMHGNVFEWCQDSYHANYREAPTNGTSWESPIGPSRVFRGGSWDGSAAWCRSAKRHEAAPEFRSGSIGFRVMRSD